MGLGLVSMQTAQKREIIPAPVPPAPPFAANSAFNGASVDTVTGQIVLGNDLNDPAMPAQLINDRQIITNGNRVTLDDALPVAQRGIYSEQVVEVSEIANASFTRMQTALNGTCQISAQSNTPGSDGILGIGNLTSSFGVQSNGLRPYFELQNPTINFRGELVLGVLRFRSANAAGNGLNIDTVANDVASTGTLSTADPGAGIGQWRLGTVVVAASALDATQYVQVMIGGVVRKLALIV